MNSYSFGAHNAALIAIGTTCGTAWAAGFRGYMVELADPASTVGWWGTFGAILLPGAIAGGLLGWAEALRRTGGRYSPERGSGNSRIQISACSCQGHTFTSLAKADFSL